MMQDDTVDGREGGRWGFVRRWAFFSLFCYLVLYYFPVILGAVPGAGRLAHWYSSALAISAGAAFGFDAPFGNELMHNGGENLFDLLIQGFQLILAVLVGLIWAGIPRRLKSDDELYAWLWTWSRYALAVTLISYGAVKFIPSQFGQLDSLRLAETYGQSSPMELLWNLMAFSKPYTVFAGCAELLPGVLLLFRRTTLLGALMAGAVLLNVTLLNFCYDVPVKLHSVNYLALAVFLVAPEARRLCRMLLLNVSVEPSALSMSRSPAGRRAPAMKLAKLTVVVMIAINSFNAAVNQSRALAKLPPASPSRLMSSPFLWIQ